MNKIGRGGEILVLDDNVTDLLIARKCFDKAKIENNWNSFNSISSFLEYMGKIERNEIPMPELVLTDINMPEMTGFEVLKLIRTNSKFTELPIIVMLTNSDSERDKTLAENLGAAGYIVKPSSLAEYVEVFDSLAKQFNPANDNRGPQSGSKGE